MLQARLLGGLDLRLDGRQLPPLSSARAESLLAYLLLHRGAPQPRQRIAFLLWPESSEAQARTNLRHLVHNLRRALPDVERFLDMTPRTLQWRGDGEYRLDVADFERAVEREAWGEAVDAYGGDLLPGAYDDWLLEERERLSELYVGALERLAREDVAYAERLVRADPLREQSYRLLMEVYDAAGDRARALRAYHACAAALERELGVEPSAATVAAYEALLPGVGAGSAVSRSAHVGRAAERARLQELWEMAERGRALLVLVSGEAGIGKTRLVEEQGSACAQRGVAVAQARSYASEGALPFGPVLEWLRALGAPRLPQRSDRHELFEAMAETFVARTPLLLIADDVQWSDRDTLQFLHYLLRTRPDARLVVAATARPEDVEPAGALDELLTALQARDQLEEVELQRLNRQETAALAAGLGAKAPLARLYEETEGNPLFVVEAVRAGAAMTPRVRAVISSRIAQVSRDARELLGVAATAGREFTVEVVGAVAGVDEDAVVRGLDELWRRGIVRAQGPDAYDFSHGKLRDAVYEQLSPAQRRRNHRRVAATLERLPEPDAVSAQIAAHYEQAGMPDRAIGWYQRAAAVAQRMHAPGEAVRLLARAVGLRPEPERELELLTALPGPLMAVDGYQSKRTLTLHERALEILALLGREPGAPLLRSIALARLAQGDDEGTVAVAEQLGARAERDGDRMMAAEAEYLLGVTAFWRGELARARRHLRASIASSDPDLSADYLLDYGTDPATICGTRLAVVLWLQGHAEEAMRARDEALARAQRLDHPYNTVTARCFTAWLALELGDVARLRADLALIDARGGPQAAIWRELLCAYVDVREGRRSGLARATRATAVQGAAPTPGFEVLVGRLAVAVHEAAGNVRGALAAAETALGRSAGHRVCEPEFRRVRGDCLRALGREEEAAAELDRALAAARSHGARALEERVLRSMRNARGTVGVGSSPST